MINNGQQNMGFDKLEKAGKVEDNIFLAVMTTGLVALLLISQMSLASGNTSSRFTFDHNYSSLEIDNPEADNNDVSIFTPDFLHVSSEKSQKVIPHWPDYDSSVVHVRNVTFSYSIRAPPLVS